jgi:crotonobetainyl-CoA:carnitine CoA-transferase CaiB-like acyl-CoA transferase
MVIDADREVRGLLDEAGVTLDPGIDVHVDGADPVLASPVPAGEAAAAAIAACAATAAQLWAERTGQVQEVRVPVRAAAASLVSFLLQRFDPPAPDRTIRPIGPVTALYQAGDGRWIHLHGGFPHLAAGTLRLLGCAGDADHAAIAAAVGRWSAAELEDELAAAGLCGAMVRSGPEWAELDQARAITPLGRVSITKLAPGEPRPAGTGSGPGDRPLAGVRTLDLTRLLAGPTAGRTLAEHGADVLLVSSPHLANVGPFVLDTSHGKRSTHLDLDDPADADRLRALAADADVVVQSYRAGALARRGFGPGDLAERHPGLVYVTVNCYGDVGPWAGSPGWEQMAESATGLAVRHGGEGEPQLVPAAPCDYVTGYLAALGALAALRRRAHEGGSYLVRASLCQTGSWLEGLPTGDPTTATGLSGRADLAIETTTPQGKLIHLPPVARLSATPPRWDRPSPPLGADPPVWL